MQLQRVFRVLKPRKAQADGDVSEEDIAVIQTAAAEFIRDGLLTLGPSFVKLGQVVSTRTGVLPKLEVYRCLGDLDGQCSRLSGKRANEIVSKELGSPFDDFFRTFRTSR